MKKFTKIAACLTAVVLSLGIAGCDKNSGITYPNFINPSESTGDNQTSEKYIVNVRAVGGLPLDGVRVSAKKNGTVIRRGISRNGKIELGVALDEYELEIDAESLPAGYYLPETVYKTNPTKREEVNIRIPSKLIESGAAASSFAVGSMMRDFTFVDTDNVSHTLSDLLKEKKAVALNFFFTGCGPCRREFPAIQKAYEGNPNIEFLAISHSNNDDNNRTVADFKSENKLTFPMGMDNIGLTNAFGVNGFPTTVIIDRYGLIAFRSSGTDTDENSWRRLFAKYTDPNYVQSISSSENPGDNPGGNPSGNLVKPNVSQPASIEMNAAGSDEGFNFTYSPDDGEYSWPWVTGADEDGSYICTSNRGVGNSHSIVYIDIPMKEGQVLSFDYCVSTEPQSSLGGDIFNIILDGDAMNGRGWSGEIGWTSTDIYVADRDKTVQLAFAYTKDAADPSPEDDEENTCKDMVMIRNIRLADKSAIENPMDVMRPCASGEQIGYSYSHYVKAVKGKDGFYHKDKADGALIYITLANVTPWSDLRGGYIVNDDGSRYDATLFNMTANNYFNADNNTCIIGDTDVYEAYETYVTIQRYMPAPYYLLPVNDMLKEWAEAFVEDFAPSDYTENSWLEFCFYYDHYGSDNYQHEGEETCNVNVDYTRGVTRFNAFNAHLGRQKAEINFPIELAHNGSYYKFTAETAGVYQLRSYTEGCSSSKVSPAVSVEDERGNPLLTGDSPRDVDQFYTDEKGDPLVVYEGFNEYIRLSAGQTVYLFLECTPGETGYYEFEITNRGEDFSTMLICSTGSGIWIGGTTYAGIRVALNPDDNCYYACDSNGEINLDQPIYVDMIHESCLISNQSKYNYFDLKRLVEANFFETYIRFGSEYQKTMERYLGEALAKDKDDPLYGMVPATAEFAEIINKYYDSNLHGGRGDGRGWLAFCVYTEYFN